MKTATEGQIVYADTTGTDTPLHLNNRNGGGACYLGFRNSGTILGYLGVDKNKKPSFWDTSNHEIVLKEQLPPYIEIGSQVIYDSFTTTTVNLKQAVLGAYGQQMISGFTPLSVPDGYSLKYYLSAQVTSSTGMYIGCNINGYSGSSLSGGTWSETRFRILVRSSLFSLSSIPYEKTLGYANNGYNLYITTNSVAGTASIYNITIHAVAVKN